MPQRTKNTPDAIDIENLLGALGEEYSVVVYWSVRFRGGRVEVIGKTYGAPYTQDGAPIHVALASFKVQQPPDLFQTLFTVAWDLWCQHDGAGATAARRGAPTTWRGYPEVPRRRRG
jgi:hypothetical protein